MSAFVMNEKEILYIACAGIALEKDGLWVEGEDNYCRDPQHIATILFNENVRSVNFRYDETNNTTPCFPTTPKEGRMLSEFILQAREEKIHMFATVLYLIGRLEYQLAEPNDYLTTNAWFILQQIKDIVVRKLLIMMGCDRENIANRVEGKLNDLFVDC